MFGKKKRTVVPTFVCPHCGAVIPAGSRACPECGSDNETGWSEDWEPADAEPAGEEDEAVVRRKRVVKSVLKIGLSLVGALTLAAFLAVMVPCGLYFGGAVFIAVVIALIVFRDGKPKLRFREKSLERELLSISGHDPARVERLVNYERSRKPDASRVELLERAIDRLRRDRGR